LRTKQGEERDRLTKTMKAIVVTDVMTFGFVGFLV